MTKYGFFVSRQHSCLYEQDREATSDSDDSEVELPSGELYPFMDKVGSVEDALLKLTCEHQLDVTEKVRNHVLGLGTDLINENKKFIYALDRVKKCTEAQQEIERKQDIQYQRKIAEDLDNRLTDLQRDREQKSRVQEKDFLEEKARIEAEKKRAEEAKAAAVEADRKAAMEAAEKVNKEGSARAAAVAVFASKVAIGRQSGASSGFVNDESSEFRSDGVKKVLQAGNLLKCAESAIKLEDRQQQIYNEVAIKKEELRLGSSSVRDHVKDMRRKIRILTKTITGAEDNVRTRADELLKIFFDSSCHQSISVAMFAEKVVEQHCLPTLTPIKVVFAQALVIVLVSSQVPFAMDLVLCQLNRACIYMAPKHITYSKSLFGTKEAYRKAIGYKEEDGVIEREESYVSRVKSCMRLYGALIQTEVGGVQNKHGLADGWAWLARFLNALPANLYTAAALLGFLDMAGFALYRRYKAQFKKLLNIIYRDFLGALKEQGQDAKLTIDSASIQSYIESNKFLEEPEGRSLPSSILSRVFSG